MPSKKPYKGARLPPDIHEMLQEYQRGRQVEVNETGAHKKMTAAAAVRELLEKEDAQRSRNRAARKKPERL